MALMVPPVTTAVTRPIQSRVMDPHQSATPSSTAATTAEAAAKSLDVKFDVSCQELVFEDFQSSPITYGDWVIVKTATSKHNVNSSSAIVSHWTDISRPNPRSLSSRRCFPVSYSQVVRISSHSVEAVDSCAGSLNRHNHRPGNPCHDSSTRSSGPCKVDHLQPEF